MTVLLLLAAAFLLGSIPFGLLIGKTQGIDIRKEGSGNIGATNVWRSLGWLWGTVSFLLDVAKGAIAPALAPFVLAPTELGLASADWQVLAGVAGVAGHMFSPFVGFRGGKGIATGLGALLGTAPLVGLSGFAVFIGVLFMCQWVSLSSLVACVAVVAFGFFFRQTPLFMIVWGMVGAFVVFKHVPNIKRLAAGTEPKFQLGQTQSTQKAEAAAPENTGKRP